MTLFQSLILSPLLDDAAPSVVLFAVSASLLVACLALKVHARAVRLSFLEHMPLNLIEKDHPHLPSRHVVAAIALCSVALLLAGPVILEGVFPFDGPSQGLNVASLFLLLAAVGILLELQWKRGGEHALAATVGTASAFLLLLVFPLSGEVPPLLPRLVFAALLLPAFLLAGRLFLDRMRLGVLLTAASSFVLWVLIGLWR